MGQKVLCPKCGAEVEAQGPGTVKCSRCGYVFDVTSLTCPSCGSILLKPEESGAAICPSCGSKIAVCPNCSAAFKIPKSVETATCPYCGTVFKAALSAAEQLVDQHFFYPLDPRDPADLLLRFLSREYGAPADLRESSSIAERTLHYVPVYFYYVSGVGEGASSASRSFKVEEAFFIGIPAIRGEIGRLLEDYPFPVRGKRFFEERFMRRGRYYEPEVSRDEADKQARGKLEGILRREAEESCENLRRFTIVEENIEYRGLIHYPVWEIKYLYAGSSYKGYVDGADGRVILAWYPQTSHARQAATGLGALALGIGVLAGLVLSPFTGGLSLIGGIAAGAAGAYPLLGRAVHRVEQASQVRELSDKSGVIDTLKMLRKMGRLGPLIIGV